RRRPAGAGSARRGGSAQRGLRPARLPRRRRRAVSPRCQRGGEPVSLPAPARLAGRLLPRGRRLRARRLPLPPHGQGRAFAHGRREHRPLGGEALPDPVAPDGRAPGLADRRGTRPGARDRLSPAAAVDVQRIESGLWRWTGFHEEWKQEVACVYLETSDAICLIDPLVPAENREKFLAALDSDVERVDLPVHVLVTVFWHTRSADELAVRYGTEVWAPSRARK